MEEQTDKGVIGQQNAKRIVTGGIIALLLVVVIAVGWAMCNDSDRRASWADRDQGWCDWSAYTIEEGYAQGYSGGYIRGVLVRVSGENWPAVERGLKGCGITVPSR